MNKNFAVTFFWKGNTIETTAQCERWPENDLDANGLAFLAIKEWFESNYIKKIPDVIGNVDMTANEWGYHWDSIIMNNSIFMNYYPF